MTRVFPLHIHIATLFLVLILLVGGIVGGVGYTGSREMLEHTAADLTERINRETLGELRRLIAPAEMATNLLAETPAAEGRTHAERMRQLALFQRALASSPGLSSLYVGFDSGDFFLLRRIRDPSERGFFKAPGDTQSIVQSIERAAAHGRFVFLDARATELAEESRPDYVEGFDPRVRDWYTSAMAAPGQVKTPPYRFYSNGKIGMTLATRARGGRSVVGADILLETLDETLARERVTPGTEIALVNAEGRVIAYSDGGRAQATLAPEATPSLARLDELGSPVLKGVAARMDLAPAGPVYARIEMPGTDWRATVRPLALEGTRPMFLVTAIPESELLAAALSLRQRSLLVTIAIILLAVPATWFVARAIATPLRRLAKEAEAIRHFEFTRPIGVRSRILEVQDLAATMDGMKRTIRRFLDISQAVAGEEKFPRLLPILLRESLSAANSRSGVLYLADKDGLIPVAAKRRDVEENIATLLPMRFGQTGPLLQSAIETETAIAGQLADEDIAVAGLEPLMAAGMPRHAIAVPLPNRQQQLVGAMLVLLDHPADPAQVAFVKALSGFAATSLETREFIRAQKELFEAFLQLIAGAIDAKSAHTGGHCARLPELTKMLARAACGQSEGPYKDFRLSDEDWEAVHLASWLHDCGKITTPEHVIDKATKLETLYDRIHEIRMRFEVLKRDAEIACLREIAGGRDEAAARAHLAAEHAALEDDFRFVAACNEGAEAMAPEKLERLHAIARRTWLRTLDDRLGVSREERERKSRTPAPALPVAEPLLADRPDHVIERPPAERIAPDNVWGFRIAVPEHLYNRGELHNLGVRQGTLSPEERYKINEHIVQTLVMLSQLPFPRHLREVPEFAGGHHEKMDGTGYPRRLTGDQMSPVARMMAIADIFEALTAVDRPYKRAKPLSEAIEILAGMAARSHIDPVLFEIFLRSGVYREYAERFMPPEQVDHVDIARYLSPAGA